MSLRSLLVGLAVAPLVVVTAFGLWLSVHEYLLYRSLEASMAVERLAVAGGRLAQAMPGEALSPREGLEDRRKEVDAALVEIETAYAGLSESQRSDPAIIRSMEVIRERSKEIAPYRARIDNGTAPLTDGLFNLQSASAAGLELARRSAALVEDLELSRFIQGGYALMQVADALRIEVRLGLQLLDGTLERRGYAFIVHARDLRRLNLPVMRHFLPKALVAEYEAFGATENGKLIERMRDRLYAWEVSGSPEPDLRARWIEATDEKKALLTDLIARVSAEQQRRTAASVDAAGTNAALAVVMLVLVCGGVAWLCARVMAAIAGPIRSLSTRIVALADGDTESPIPCEQRKDEIGEIAHGVGVFRSTLRQLTETKRRVEHLALHDQLTGLPNRRALEAYLEEALSRPSQQARRVALLHLDLDRFKQVNDRLGHGAGDEVLRRAAEAMRAALRPGDVASRVGGDEFVILLRDVEDERTVSLIAERLIRAISEPMVLGEAQAQIGASIGAAYAGDAACDAGRLLMNADIALYEAKEAGRGRHRFYSEEARMKFERRRALIDEFQAELDLEDPQPGLDRRAGG